MVSYEGIIIRIIINSCLTILSYLNHGKTLFLTIGNESCDTSGILSSFLLSTPRSEVECCRASFNIVILKFQSEDFVSSLTRSQAFIIIRVVDSVSSGIQSRNLSTILHSLILNSDSDGTWINDEFTVSINNIQISSRSCSTRCNDAV